MSEFSDVTVSHRRLMRNVCTSYLVMAYGLFTVSVVIDSCQHGSNLTFHDIVSLIFIPLLLPLTVFWACGNFCVGYLSLAKLAGSTLTPLVVWCLLFALFQLTTVRLLRSKLRSSASLDCEATGCFIMRRR